MKKYSEICNAKAPETLRGTRIKQKVATDGLERGIDENELNKLSDYLGHTPLIHKLSYRQRVFDRDVTISEQVKKAQGLRSTSHQDLCEATSVNLLNTDHQLIKNQNIDSDYKSNDNSVTFENNEPVNIKCQNKNNIVHGKKLSFAATSPSKSNITVKNIQNWVELSIRRRSQ
ncbi:uncharacterized protein LOC131671697 [Phymastichus coffea]|uniref:uncharacterized protein LOC131671697 n=1 Tax=Phymastichus coffea TaxID=108790 RepID=UPI00273C7EF9|nr:uncharacterized protein LOC131671697 [Phymastichus coffea]